MKTRLTTIFLLFSASPAAAHYGHLGDLAGHAHWVAIGAAAAVGAIAAALIKQRRNSDEANETSGDSEEPEEAAS